MMPAVIYEDNHLIAVNKPAGLASTHFEGTDETVDRLVKAYLKDKFQKPGNVFLGVVHRLDKPTSGVLLFARTSKAAARLSEQFKAGTAKKVYVAVVNEKPNGGRGAPELTESGTLEDHLVHDDDAREVRVVREGTAGAKVATCVYTTVQRAGGNVLLALRPQTGRKHQLRVQLASRGFPILGDAKYGSPVRYDGFIALHAKQLTVTHPVSKEPIELRADVPTEWGERFAGLLM